MWRTGCVPGTERKGMWPERVGQRERAVHWAGQVHPAEALQVTVRGWKFILRAVEIKHTDAAS